MLKKFIRLEEKVFDPQDEVCHEQTQIDSCEELFEYVLPFKVGDNIKWIQERPTFINSNPYDFSDYKLGIYNCGQIVAQDVGTIQEHGSNQIFCNVIIPDIELDNCYEFIIYADFNPVEDCSIYAGTTLGDLIDSGIVIGDVLNCIPVPDWE